MVLVSIPITAFPEMPPQATSTYGFTVSGASNLMDANGEKVANVFVATKTGNISKIYVRFGTVTTPQDVDIRVESVDLTTGSPSGNLLAANTNGTILSASVSTSTERSVASSRIAARSTGASDAAASSHRPRAKRCEPSGWCQAP